MNLLHVQVKKKISNEKVGGKQELEAKVVKKGGEQGFGKRKIRQNS